MSLTVLGIDPGPVESAYVHWNGRCILGLSKLPNAELLVVLPKHSARHVVIEMIASYGMAVGAEVFETCVWIGRFMESSSWGPANVHRMPRLAVKQHLCHDSRAKDANIRAALMDRFGGPASVKKGGSLYGVHGDCWAALAVAATWYDLHGWAPPAAGAAVGAGRVGT